MDGVDSKSMNFRGGWPRRAVVPAATWTVETMASDGQKTQSPQLDAAFERIFERYYRPVSYYFARRGFSPDECRDLAQETFLRAYKRWEHYRRDKEDASGWLFTIAANLYRNTLRDRKAKNRDAPKRSLVEMLEQGNEPADEDADPETLATLNEQRRLVDEALEELPPRMRQCFLLRYRQGRKYREIAEVMQISIQSVRSQLANAKTRLREKLG